MDQINSWGSQASSLLSDHKNPSSGTISRIAHQNAGHVSSGWRDTSVSGNTPPILHLFEWGADILLHRVMILAKMILNLIPEAKEAQKAYNDLFMENQILQVIQYFF
jgi:hypothetical protein